MYRSESSLLFVGPSAQAVALIEADAWGRIVGNFGDPKKGINTEAAREAASALSSMPIGDRRAAVVVGPIDVTSKDDVVDVLLKVLEEPDEGAPRAFLWAWDEGSVRPTIRSRCLTPRWCPGRRTIEPSTHKVAKSMVRAALANESAGVLEAFGELGKEEWRECAPDLIRAAIDLLAASENWGAAQLSLWAKLRNMSSAHPSRIEILDGFLP